MSVNIEIYIYMYIYIIYQIMSVASWWFGRFSVFSIYWESSSQLTKSYFPEELKPPIRSATWVSSLRACACCGISARIFNASHLVRNHCFCSFLRVPRRSWGMQGVCKPAIYLQYLFIYLSIYLSIDLSIDQSINLKPESESESCTSKSKSKLNLI